MFVFLYNEKKEAVLSEISLIEHPKKLAKLTKNWNFDWKSIKLSEDIKIYAIRLSGSTEIEGLLKLKTVEAMLIMDLLEIAPHNIGKSKKYTDAAACLIAFACRESFNWKTIIKAI